MLLHLGVESERCGNDAAGACGGTGRGAAVADRAAGIPWSQTTQRSPHIRPACVHRAKLTRVLTSVFPCIHFSHHARVLDIVAGEPRDHGRLHRDCQQAIRASAGQSCTSEPKAKHANLHTHPRGVCRPN